MLRSARSALAIFRFATILRYAVDIPRLDERDIAPVFGRQFPRSSLDSHDRPGAIARTLKKGFPPPFKPVFCPDMATPPLTHGRPFLHSRPYNTVETLQILPPPPRRLPECHFRPTGLPMREWILRHGQ